MRIDTDFNVTVQLCVGLQTSQDLFGEIYMGINYFKSLIVKSAYS